MMLFYSVEIFGKLVVILEQISDISVDRLFGRLGFGIVYIFVEMPVVKLRLTTLTVIARKHVIFGDNNIFGITRAVRLAALHISVEKTAVRYAAYKPSKRGRTSETVIIDVQLDDLYKLCKLANIDVYEIGRCVSSQMSRLLCPCCSYQRLCQSG